MHLSPVHMGVKNPRLVSFRSIESVMVMDRPLTLLLLKLTTFFFYTYFFRLLYRGVLQKNKGRKIWKKLRLIRIIATKYTSIEKHAVIHIYVTFLGNKSPLLKAVLTEITHPYAKDTVAIIAFICIYIYIYLKIFCRKTTQCDDKLNGIECQPSGLFCSCGRSAKSDNIPLTPKEHYEGKNTLESLSLYLSIGTNHFWCPKGQKATLSIT